MSFHDSGAGRAMRLRRPRLVIPVAITVVAIIAFFMVFAGVWTDRLWFDAIGFASVFQTVLFTQVTLFTLGGVLMAIIVGGNVFLAYRLRPLYVDTVLGQQGVDRYRMSVDPHRKTIFWVGLGALFLLAGSSTGGQWKTWLLFVNQAPFGKQDAQFGMDISFFTFTYPFLRLLLDFLFAAVVVATIASLVVHYLYGGFRLQPGTPRAERGTRAHLSALIGVFVLLKAGAYWLDRYGLAFSESGYVEGPSYTDVHAVLPAKTILAIIALLCAALFFLGIVRSGGMIPGVALGLLVLAAVLVGGLYPTLIEQFRVQPNQQAAERPYIQRNIDSTRASYDVADAKVEEYDATTQAKPEELQKEASTISGVRLLDPSVVSTTYQVQQQIRDFYEFPETLDIDRYPTDQGAGDTVVSVREMSGPPASQDTWINRHLVYTHGYGFVAAPGNEVDAEGKPQYNAKDMPPTGTLVEQVGLKVPQIYYGERSGDYAIVGGPEGGRKMEFDYPISGTGAGQENTTYTGKGGVPIGSMFNRLLFLAKYGEPNFFLNSDINEHSKIVFDRTPRQRIEKAAPYLTVDSDPYPAMVNGRIKWIVDGYTTSDRIPYSQRVDIESATSDTATDTRGLARQREEINYIRNSVKAVVDAYDGTVDLYQWDERDPVLKTWMKAFPGTVKPKSAISEELRGHMRYPTDMFKVQREMLSKYHVSDANEFYGGQAFWNVPSDPTQDGNAKQPPYYLSLKMPGDSAPKFSLTTLFVPRERPNLAGFMAADATPGENYGKIRILQLPSNTAIPGPTNAHNSMNTNQLVANQLNQMKIGGTQVINGNLLTLPFGGGLLYVEPIYVQAKGSGTFPTLRWVVAQFGDQVGFGTTLEAALEQIFKGGTAPQSEDGEQTGEQGDLSAEARAALQEAQDAFQRGQDALKEGDWEAYGKAQKELQDALNKVAESQGTPSEESREADGSTPEPSPTD